MGKKKKVGHSEKKNSEQRKAYMETVRNGRGSSEGTVNNIPNSLTATNELCENAQNVNPDNVKKKPIRYIIKDWWKKSWVQTLVITVIAGVIVTIVGSVGESMNTVKTQLAVLNERVNYIEDKINNLSNTAPNKENLQLQLEMLHKELDSNDAEITDIKNKLNELESMIE